MLKFGKIQNNSGKTPTHRAENIFPKYLLYNVHEIAQKYPRDTLAFLTVYCIGTVNVASVQYVIFQLCGLYLLWRSFLFFIQQLSTFLRLLLEYEEHLRNTLEKVSSPTLGIP
jgi:hypothetical protein